MPPGNRSERDHRNRERAERDTERSELLAERNQIFPIWVQIAGAAFGAITLIFLAALILMSVYGLVIPDNARYLLCFFFSLGGGLSTAFLGADAAARGRLPFGDGHVIEVAAGGGVAIVLILFTLALWATRPDGRPSPNVTIERRNWIERTCDWAFHGAAANTLRTVGPKFTAEKWYDTEPAGRVDCEIVYNLDLSPPYRVAVDILPLNGQGKGGLIIGDDGSGFVLFEANAKDGDLVVWKTNPFESLAYTKGPISFNKFSNLRVDVYKDVTFYYFNGSVIFTKPTINSGNGKVGLRSAWSVVEFSKLQITRL